MSTTPRQERPDVIFSSGERQDAARGRGIGSPMAAAAELSGRWQIPLLAVSLTLLGLAVWRLRPQPKPPGFDQVFARAVTLHDAGLGEEASKYAESLLAEPSRTPAEKARLHRFIAEVIFAHESQNAVHGPNNCRRILENLDRSLLEHETFTAAAHRMRALAREWLNEPGEAVAEYRQALAKGIEQPWGIRRHVLEIQRAAQTIGDEPYQRELDAFLAEREVPAELRFWAAEQRITMLAAAGKHAEAEQLLESHRKRFETGRWSSEYDYLRSLAWYHVGKHDDAERLLRKIRDEVTPGKPLYTQVGWLLGTILKQQNQPEAALSVFEEVIDKGLPSPSRSACLLARADCLADLEQYDASLKVFEEVVRLASESPLTPPIDLKDVRESATAWYQALLIGGRRDRAMPYLQLAARLAPAADGKVQALYAQRMADLAMDLGRAALARAGTAGANASAEQQAARQYLMEAGENYLRLAALAGDDGPEPVEPIWKAADAYDLAGERARMIQVLEAFAKGYPESTRVPEALLQLGRAYQASGDLARAIESYQDNLIRFPRTPAALASLVPLSDCFIALKQGDKAEQTLLRIVTPRPSDNLALITPEAPEYQDALFRLGDMYMQSERYEQAITRYEEALERYAADPRADVAAFHLADAYRRSAARLRKDIEDPKNTALKDSLKAEHQDRLQRAQDMFDRVVERYSRRPEASLTDLDRLSLKLSQLYAADAVYDLSILVQAGGIEPFARSLPLYEKTAWIYQREPIAMSAYVQIVNCYLRMGKVSQAWMSLQRARWALRNIPDEAFLKYAPDEDRAFWENYLQWLEKKPTFASMALAKAG